MTIRGSKVQRKFMSTVLMGVLFICNILHISPLLVLHDIVWGSLLIEAATVCVAAKIAQVLCIFGKLPPCPPVLPLFLIVARRRFVNQSGGKLDLHYSKVD